MNERAIQDAVAPRAAQLGGGGVSPRDVRVELVEANAAPGCALYRASWGAGALTAVVFDDREIDTFPAHAMGRIFYRWLAAEPLPDPRHAARVAAAVFDPEGRRRVVLDEGDVPRDDWRQQVQMPVLLHRAVAFSWIDRHGPATVRVRLEADGEASIEPIPNR